MLRRATRAVARLAGLMGEPPSGAAPQDRAVRQLREALSGLPSVVCGEEDDGLLRELDGLRGAWLAVSDELMASMYVLPVMSCVVVRLEALAADGAAAPGALMQTAQRC